MTCLFQNDLFGGGQGGGFEMVGGDNSLGDGLLDMGSVEPSGGLLDMDAAPPLVNEQSAPEQSVPAVSSLYYIPATSLPVFPLHLKLNGYHLLNS